MQKRTSVWVSVIATSCRRKPPPKEKLDRRLAKPIRLTSVPPRSETDQHGGSAEDRLNYTRKRKPLPCLRMAGGIIEVCWCLNAQDIVVPSSIELLFAQVTRRFLLELLVDLGKLLCKVDRSRGPSRVQLVARRGQTFHQVFLIHENTERHGTLFDLAARAGATGYFEHLRQEFVCSLLTPESPP
jgi:hypothetical protein